MINKTVVQNWMDKVEKATLYIIMIIGIIMLFVVWAHVFYRYFLNNSLSWSEEFLKICLVWFSLLSASIITKRSEHLGIIIFVQKMPKKVQTILSKVVKVLMLLACIIVTVVGFMLVIKSSGQLTPALKISYGLVYAAIPVSFMLMFLYELCHLVGKNTKEDLGSNMAKEESFLEHDQAHPSNIVTS